MHSIKIAIIILVVFLLGALGALGCGYFAYKDLKSDKEKLEEEIDDLKADLKSAESKSGSGSGDCESTLTDNEESVVEDWESYTNETYNYTFKYPTSWQLKSEDENMVTFTDDTDDIDLEFQFRSERMTEIGVDTSYSKTSTSTTQIACVDATKAYFTSDEHNLIWVTFEKDSTPHLLILTYSSTVGASVSSDVGEEFDIVLKTIEFSS